MKKFNKVIKIEVSVDTIAEAVLGQMNESFPHRQLLVESIFATASDHQIGLMYNSLHGYLPDVNFNVGDIIIPKDFQVYAYWDGKESQSYKTVNEVVIVDIDHYKQEKLKVEYSYPNRKGEMELTSKWISHIGCELFVDIATIAEKM